MLLKISILLSERLRDSSLVTRAVRHRVLKWALFVFRIFISIMFCGSTSGLMLIGSPPDDKFFVVSRTV